MFWKFILVPFSVLSSWSYLYDHGRIYDHLAKMVKIWSYFQVKSRIFGSKVVFLCQEACYTYCSDYSKPKISKKKQMPLFHGRVRVSTEVLCNDWLYPSHHIFSHGKSDKNEHALGLNCENRAVILKNYIIISLMSFVSDFLIDCMIRHRYII